MKVSKKKRNWDSAFFFWEGLGWWKTCIRSSGETIDLSSEEAVPESVDDGREVEEEAENDVDGDVDVAVGSVDEDCQWLKEWGS